MKYFFLLLTFLILSPTVWGVGKIQREGVKTLAEIVAAGGSMSHLVGTDQIYDTTNSQLLSTTISSSFGVGISGGSTGAAIIPAGTTGQRPGSPVNGYTRYNSTTKTMEFYSNSAWAPLEFVSPPNTVSFTSTGASTWTVPAGVTHVAVLVVAGGGAGGQSNAGVTTCGGGGSGGGVRFSKYYPVVAGAGIKVWVGSGGTTSGSAGNPGGNGGNSVFGDLVALGGTGGNGRVSTGTNNGQGGGASFAGTDNFTYSDSTLSIYATNGYFNGGAVAGSSGSTEVCGGGAGAAANGLSASTGIPGNGGPGVSLFGTAYGGGGGGGAYPSVSPADGGIGGGANGAAAGAAGTAGANLGGGGGGGSSGSNASGGGTGVVKVFYYN